MENIAGYIFLLLLFLLGGLFLYASMDLINISQSCKSIGYNSQEFIGGESYCKRFNPEEGNFEYHKVPSMEQGGYK